MTPVDKQFVLDVANTIHIPYEFDDKEEYLVFNAGSKKVHISIKPIVLHNKAYVRTKLPREDFVNKAVDYVRNCFKEGMDND